VAFTKFLHSDNAISPAESTVRTSNLDMKKGAETWGVSGPWGVLGASLFAAYIRLRRPSPTGKNDRHHPAMYPYPKLAFGLIPTYRYSRFSGVGQNEEAITAWFAEKN
jgi:hypothetical protein